MGALEHQVAVVTGSSRGVGKGIALELARQGADVVVTGRTDRAAKRSGGGRRMPDGTDRAIEEFPGTLEETAEEIRDLGRRALTVSADLTHREDVERLAAVVLEEFGTVDILVNNAAATGETAVCSFWDPSPDPRWPALTVEQWDWIFALNVTAPFLLTRLLAPAMRAHGGGVVIAVTSGAGHVDYSPPGDDSPESGLPGVIDVPLMAYGASKAALDRFVQTLAPEVFADGIYAIVLDPGGVATEITMRGAAKHGLDLSRFQPVAVPAKAAAFLAQRANARRYTGRIAVAREIVEANGL